MLSRSTLALLLLLLFPLVSLWGEDCDPDIEPPSVTCPPDFVMPINCPTDPDHTGYASATDNCDWSPTITFRDSLLVGGFRRIWTAEDDAGNASSCIQSIGLGAPVGSCICGDVDGSGNVNLTDAITLMNYIFGIIDHPNGGKMDVNCDGRISMSDVVSLVWYIFSTGSPPCDPDEDGLPNCFGY